MKAELWGVGIDGKGGGRYNGWEAIVYPTYIIASVILVVGVGFAPDTSIKTWANNEARVRLNMKDRGELEEGAEFGVHYNIPEKVYQFEAEDVDQMPRTEYVDHYGRDRN